MVNPFKKTPTAASKEIDRLTGELEYLDPTSKEYKSVIKRISELAAIDAPRKKSLNIEATPIIAALITAAASIVCVMKITEYEEEEIITTKALGFIPKK